MLGPLGGTKLTDRSSLVYGRDGHATKTSWHGLLAREGLGSMKVSLARPDASVKSPCPLRGETGRLAATGHCLNRSSVSATPGFVRRLHSPKKLRRVKKGIDRSLK